MSRYSSEKIRVIWRRMRINQAKALAPIVAACQKQGAKMAIQLNHAGRKCEAQEKIIYAPSAIPFS